MVDVVLSQLKVDDGMGGDLTLLRHARIEGDRLRIYQAACPDLLQGTAVAALYANAAGEKLEHLVLVKGDSATVITRECAITLDDLPLSQFVEYRFGSDGPWMLSRVCFAALEEYRKVKFGFWKDLMLHPTCEAAFKRMLKLGLICKLYDENAFPESPEDKANWEVTDEKTGHLVHVPHPVHSLRLWNAEAGEYMVVESRLGGAPPAGGEEKYWSDFCAELEESHGKDYLDQLRAA